MFLISTVFIGNVLIIKEQWCKYIHLIICDCKNAFVLNTSLTINTNDVSLLSWVNPLFLKYYRFHTCRIESKESLWLKIPKDNRHIVLSSFISRMLVNKEVLAKSPHDVKHFQSNISCAKSTTRKYSLGKIRVYFVSGSMTSMICNCLYSRPMVSVSLSLVVESPLNYADHYQMNL